MNEDAIIDQALRDITEIRRAINASKSPAAGAKNYSARGNIAIHFIALFLAAILLFFESMAMPSLTGRLFATYFIEDFRFLAVYLIFAFLAATFVLFYLIVFYGAHNASEPVPQYLARNFAYLGGISFISDLFIKFSAVSLVILAGRPDWVAALLFACIGDYLLQGRFFVLPVKWALPLGVFMMVAGVTELIMYKGALLWPLLGFTLITLMSLLYIFHIKKTSEQ